MHDSFKMDKCAVIYGRWTNLLGPVRMALRGLLIALLGEAATILRDKIYSRGETIVSVVRSAAAAAVQRRFGGSRSPRYSLSWISAVSRMHAIRSKAGLLRCIRDNASVRWTKNT